MRELTREASEGSVEGGYGNNNVHSISNKWSETLRAVLGRHEDRTQKINGSQNNIDNSDMLGEEITNILNNHPRFAYNTSQQQQQRQEESYKCLHETRDTTNNDFDDEEIFYPILSKGNFNKVQRSIRSLFNQLRQLQNVNNLQQLIYNSPKLFRRIARKITCYESLSASLGYHPVIQDTPSIIATLRFCILFLICSMSLLIILTQLTLIWIFQFIVAFISTVIPIIVDIDDISSLCPSSIAKKWDIIINFFKRIDNEVLNGQRIAGRVEEKEKKKIKQQISATKTNRSNFSSETLQHFAAMSYCHDMLHAEYLRKEEKNKRKKLLLKQQRSQHSNKRRQSLSEIAEEPTTAPNKSRRQYHEEMPTTIPESDSLSPTKVFGTSNHRNGVGQFQQDFDHMSSFSDGVLDTPRNNKLYDLDTSIGDFLSDESDVQSTNEDESLSTRSSFTDDDEISASTSQEEVYESEKEHDHYLRNRRPKATKKVGKKDLNWLDVGTRIGVRILNSENVQRAIASQDTAERIKDISETFNKPPATTGDNKVDADLNNMFGGGVKANDRLAYNNGDSDGYGVQVEQHSGTAGRTKRMLSPQKPVHAMWTSPSDAIPEVLASMSSMSGSGGGADDILVLSSSENLLSQSIHSTQRSDDSVSQLYDTQNDETEASTHFSNTSTTDKSSLFGDYVTSTDKNLALSCDDDPVQRKWKERQHMDEKELINDNYNKMAQVTRSTNSSLCALRERRDETNEQETVTSHLLRKERSGSVEESGPSTSGTSKRNNPRDGFSASAAVSSSQPAVLAKGTKIVVPIQPLQPNPFSVSSRGGGTVQKQRIKVPASHYQMATVVSSKRIYVGPATVKNYGQHQISNCLSVTVKLDKSFLRGGRFAEMTLRIMDEWSSRYRPRHSKFPIGACVATSFGVGILVSWRVQDDCHVVRAMWQHRGPGTAHAYLNRDAIHGVVEAAVGFTVETKLGTGDVLAYVDGGRKFLSGRYVVIVKDEVPQKSHWLEFERSEILSCEGAQFVPTIEYIREAAQYHIQYCTYEAAVRQRELELRLSDEEHVWQSFSKGFDLLWSSFLKAIEEDSDFDDSLSAFFSSIIQFLERIDNPEAQQDINETDTVVTSVSSTTENVHQTPADKAVDNASEPGFWVMDALFGGIFSGEDSSRKDEDPTDYPMNESFEVIPRTFEKSTILSKSMEGDSYRTTFAVLRALMRTVAISRASCGKDQPNFRLALSMCYDLLLLIRTIVKVQQKNLSPDSVATWKQTIEDIVTTFGPIQERLEKIGNGIAERLEKEGKRAKIRILRFVDIILVDDRLLSALENGQWDRCIVRLERALLKARIIEPESREHYRNIAMFIIKQFPSPSQNESAMSRNSEKLAWFAKVVKWMATPERSLFSLLKRDEFLEIIERILVRVFKNEPEASGMITIHASTFHTFRHLRMLKDFTISGKLWMPLLDAADDEFSWTVSRMPDKSKEFLTPLAKLFSLCVTQFHIIAEGDLTRDWLEFLMDDNAVTLINEIDGNLVLYLQAFCKDIKDVMVVMPYYPSIDDDILNLMDEVDIKAFLKETSDAVGNDKMLERILKEKATIALERFLDYLPKMSIPVEQRELSDGWVLTCRDEHGGDLTLTDVHIKRENLVCQIMGFLSVFDMFGEGNAGAPETAPGTTGSAGSENGIGENSILDDIRELLLNAQRHGCWEAGTGGVGQPASDPHVRAVLGGLPVSQAVDSSIELWKQLEIDDDELLEIVIRDVSYQIQIQKQLDEGSDVPSEQPGSLRSTPYGLQQQTNSFEIPRQKFNPRMDPTVLYLEMNKVTLHLDKFKFRIEKLEKTIFDPVFEGYGFLAVEDVSIKLRVECRKERISQTDAAPITVPKLQLGELDVHLFKVDFKVEDTGAAGAILNMLLQGLSDELTTIVEVNLREQVQKQIELALENVNNYSEVNPDLILTLLGITMDELEEKTILC